MDGSRRHSFPAVLRSHTEPLGLAVFESRFFWTDGTELVSAAQASPQEHAVLLRAPVSAFTVVHVLQQPPREYPARCLHWCRAGSTPTASLGAGGGCAWVLELTRSVPHGSPGPVVRSCRLVTEGTYEPVGKLLSPMALGRAEPSYLVMLLPCLG